MPDNMEFHDGNSARDRILAEFIKETGFDETVATTYLESENWNLQQARVDLQRIKIDEESRNETSMPERRHGPELAKIGRGLSMANSEIVATARDNILKMKADESSLKLDEIPHSSFLLPDVSQFDADFVDFLKKDLIDKHSWRALTDSGHLNWWTIIGACRKLFPLSTIGDGNCLLHAASLGMWGFHDRLLTLRKALHKYITMSDAHDVIKRRWKYVQWKSNMESGGLTFTAEEWDDEWQEVLRLASDSPRLTKERRTRRISRQATVDGGGSGKLRRSHSNNSDCFESLEEFHVYALAHVLRRPIIIISDTVLKNYDGEALSPIPFGGIYIPTECDPADCYKFPLVLAYDSGHFSACVPAEGEDDSNSSSRLSSSVPLVSADSRLLPIHFIVDPGEAWAAAEDGDCKKPNIEEPNEDRRIQLLQRYLSVVKVQVKHDGTKTTAVEKTEKRGSLTLRIKEKASGSRSPLLGRALGKISSMLASNGSMPSTLYAANLDMDNRPKYYSNMIANYINSSQKRFKLDRAQIVQQQIKCQSPGCQRFGSLETDSMCSICYDVRSNLSQGNNAPYSTLQGLHQTADGNFHAAKGSSALSSVAQLCKSDGCKFYGSHERDGFCSSCHSARYRHDVYY